MKAPKTTLENLYEEAQIRLSEASDLATMAINKSLVNMGEKYNNKALDEENLMRAIIRVNREFGDFFTLDN